MAVFIPPDPLQPPNQGRIHLTLTGKPAVLGAKAGAYDIEVLGQGVYDDGDEADEHRAAPRVHGVHLEAQTRQLSSLRHGTHRPAEGERSVLRYSEDYLFFIVA